MGKLLSRVGGWIARAAAPAILRAILGGGKDRTQAAAPGRATSEWRLAVLGQLVGAAMIAAGAIWPDLPADELREVLMWAGSIVLTGSGAAYAASRAAVKREIARGEAVRAIQADALADARVSSRAALIGNASAPNRKAGK